MASRPLLQTSRHLARYYKLTSQLILTRSQSNCAGKWQIMGAACIIRPPVICPPMKPIEQQYSEMLATVEKERSLKSDHELRREKDLLHTELMKTDDEDLNLEEASKQTALEFEDACDDELKAFNASMSVPGVDVKDLGSLNHSLERSVILVVKQKLGTSQEWVLPQTPWLPGETLRQTCERLTQEACGDNLKVKFLSNAPCGFYKYKYPKNARTEGFIGAKVFFYKGQVRENNGSVYPGENIVEYQWLTHDKLDEKFKQSYAKSVSMFLVSDQ
ncbi:large ribosomal subunit protein mL46 [Procambarus clarkii]|uniref:large ribosomal subunit protein mL46 n=1 Tax=Procambarus clarkii TaxID=6728 RepID=UPI001E676300|nr:39S ribosomal protein L46, mitochondrial-like [Procambarus clarkii]